MAEEVIKRRRIISEDGPVLVEDNASMPSDREASSGLGVALAIALAILVVLALVALARGFFNPTNSSTSNSSPTVNQTYPATPANQ